MGGRGSSQHIDEAAAAIKGTRGDEINGAGGREASYRPDDPQRHPGMMDHQLEAGAKGDDGGRGVQDHRNP